MTGELILFPARAYVRVVRVALRGSVEVTSRILSLATQAIRSVTPDGSAGVPGRTVPDGVAIVEAADAVAPVEDPTAAPPRPVEAQADEGMMFVPPPEATPLQAEPLHVSEEPALVDEFAEPGAEHGAGAEVTITEPWEGYAAMTARDVIGRLGDATPAELAAVQLYEAAHRRRATVIAEVERELRTKSGSGAAAADQARKEHTDG